MEVVEARRRHVDREVCAYHVECPVDGGRCRRSELLDEVIDQDHDRGYVISTSQERVEGGRARATAFSCDGATIRRNQIGKIVVRQDRQKVLLVGAPVAAFGGKQGIADLGDARIALVGR